MTYTSTPRQQAQQARFDTLRAHLAQQGVKLIVGGGYRGHEGTCIRLAYRKDLRGNGDGYTASVEIITREGSKTTVTTSSQTQVVRSQEVAVDGVKNMAGGDFAICTLVDTESAHKAFDRLLSSAPLDREFVL